MLEPEAPDSVQDDQPGSDAEASLFDALGLRDSASRMLGVLLRLDAQYQAIADTQIKIDAKLGETNARIDEWDYAVKSLSLAGNALVKGAQSRVLYLLIGIALGIGALSIDAVGRAVVPLLVSGVEDAP